MGQRMKVIVVGASGTLGAAIAAELGERHEIVRAGRSGVDVEVDVRDLASVEAMYRQVGEFDAVVAAMGTVHFEPLASFTPAQYEVGLSDKLMGQVNLVLAGQQAISGGGSFTLTSGVLSRDPIRTGSSASMVNAAVDGFVIAAAIELSRGVRVNAVSATVFEESMEVYGKYFRGFKPIPVRDAARAFVKSVEGHHTGRIYAVD
jgi:NAD(P)-dependent dehydrogenase (short-subunit alcohol dehydrogenase family)